MRKCGGKKMPDCLQLILLPSLDCLPFSKSFSNLTSMFSTGFKGTGDGWFR